MNVILECDPEKQAVDEAIICDVVCVKLKNRHCFPSMIYTGSLIFIFFAVIYELVDHK